MTPILAFDIETVPDVAGLRALYEVGSEVSDTGVVEMAQQRRRQAGGTDFLQLHLHRVVAISCALRERDDFRVWSLGDAKDEEGRLIQRFYDGIEKYTPQLVSWNGGGFDLPVLHYRGLIHGVRAARYWDLGEDDRDFKWNNYISRYHTRHLDLMDVLAMYQPRAAVALDGIAQLMGLPGKIGIGGAAVWDAYREGRLGDIRSYCEADVANTYLVYLAFQKMRGALTADAWQAECALVRDVLAGMDEPHWREFLERWRPPG